MQQSPKWYLLSLEDTSNLAGTSIQKIIQSIAVPLEVKYVIVENISCPGALEIIQSKNYPVFSLENLLNLLPGIAQFDWTNFYLFKSAPSDMEHFFSQEEFQKIKLSTATVRAVDYSYIYIYTPCEKVLEHAKNCGFRIDFVKEGALDSLDYPS